MLRKIRIVVAGLILALVTLLFLDFTGVIHHWFGWLAKIQLLPAILAGNVVIMAVLVVLTLLFGRLYCSVICPLGIMQDLISWFHTRKKKGRFGFRPERRVWRYVTLVVFVVLLLLGVNGIALLIAPYSAFGRIASTLFAPLYRWGNNLLALAAERVDSYAFYSTEVWLKSGLTLAVAAVTLLLVGFLAWRGGRTWCNTICPVGTVLGLLSRFSLFRPVINTDKCINCGICAKRCKASCINPKAHRIDLSRCVVCMDCLENCSVKAISYKPMGWTLKKESAPTIEKCEGSVSRGAFLTLLGVTLSALTLKAQKTKVDGGLALLEKKQLPVRKLSVKPAGAVSLSHFEKHCTACQLCVSACPNQVLRPSSSFATLMQPEMQFDRGYCRPECTRCSEVCPTGAILKITPQIKASTQVGVAKWVAANCVVKTDGVKCGNCARHCPVGAIIMMPLKKDEPEGRAFPAINKQRCIGCGACENVCPARPVSAIYVEGIEVQHEL